jgi:hypothetical protein
MKGLTVFAILVTFSILSSHAQTSVIGRVETEIAVPVTAVETTLLNFGKVVSQSGGGTIQISPKGERVATGSVVLLDELFSAGKFVLSGVPNGLVSIVLPQTAQKLSLSNGNNEITVDQFTSDVPVGGQIVRQSDGKAEVSIGATMYLGDGLNNPAGFYAGTYEAVFMYN